jgi:hypothetical protein
MAKFKAGDKIRPIPGTMGVGFRPYHLTILAVGSQTYFCQYDGVNHNKCEMIATIAGIDGTYELFVEPKTRTGYLNVFKNSDGELVVGTAFHDTIRSAISPGGGHQVGRIKVELVEGKFDE